MPANLLRQGLNIGAFIRFRHIQADVEVFPVTAEHGGKPAVIVGKPLPELVAVQKALLHLLGVDKAPPCLAQAEIAVGEGAQLTLVGPRRDELVTDVGQRVGKATIGVIDEKALWPVFHRLCPVAMRTSLRPSSTQGAP